MAERSALLRAQHSSRGYTSSALRAAARHARGGEQAGDLLDQPVGVLGLGNEQVVVGEPLLDPPLVDRRVQDDADVGGALVAAQRLPTSMPLSSGIDTSMTIMSKSLVAMAASAWRPCLASTTR
jgi:hypothetical protein